MVPASQSANTKGISMQTWPKINGDAYVMTAVLMIRVTNQGLASASFSASASFLAFSISSASGLKPAGVKPLTHRLPHSQSSLGPRDQSRTWHSPTGGGGLPIAGFHIPGGPLQSRTPSLGFQPSTAHYPSLEYALLTWGSNTCHQTSP